MNDGAVTYRQAFIAGLTPDPDHTVSTWADSHRMLSQKASAEPGRWRTERTPYLREIMDEMSPSSPAQRVVIIDGQSLREGQALPNGARLERVTPEGAVLLWQGRRFTLRPGE